MKQVYLAQDPIEAHLVVDLLEAEGIPAVVQGEHLYAVRGLVPVNYPTVWVVNDADYDRARELALEYDREQRAPAEAEALEPWVCSACGETIDGHFDRCWHCGADRPAGNWPDP